MRRDPTNFEWFCKGMVFAIPAALAIWFREPLFLSAYAAVAFAVIYVSIGRRDDDEPG